VTETAAPDVGEAGDGWTERVVRGLEQAMAFALAG
jgi:hypothetical protein